MSTFGPAVRMARHTLTPSSPGSITSSRTRSNGVERARSSAFRPSSASSIANPARSRCRCKSSRIAASSSTTSTVRPRAGSAMPTFSLGGRRGKQSRRTPRRGGPPRLPRPLLADGRLIDRESGHERQRATRAMALSFVATLSIHTARSAGQTWQSSSANLCPSAFSAMGFLRVLPGSIDQGQKE